jgi:hypothetical protein
MPKTIIRFRPETLTALVAAGSVWAPFEGLRYDQVCNELPASIRDELRAHLASSNAPDQCIQVQLRTMTASKGQAKAEVATAGAGNNNNPESSTKDTDLQDRNKVANKDVDSNAAQEEHDNDTEDDEDSEDDEADGDNDAKGAENVEHDVAKDCNQNAAQEEDNKGTEDNKDTEDDDADDADDAKNFEHDVAKDCSQNAANKHNKKYTTEHGRQVLVRDVSYAEPLVSCSRDREGQRPLAQTELEPVVAAAGPLCCPTQDVLLAADGNMSMLKKLLPALKASLWTTERLETIVSDTLDAINAAAEPAAPRPSRMQRLGWLYRRSEGRSQLGQLYDRLLAWELLQESQGLNKRAMSTLYNQLIATQFRSEDALNS